MYAACHTTPTKIDDEEMCVPWYWVIKRRDVVLRRTTPSKTAAGVARVRSGRRGSFAARLGIMCGAGVAN
jgi:hypothetical protein